MDKSKQINIRVSDEFMEEIERFCADKGISKSEFMRRCVEEGIRHEGYDQINVDMLEFIKDKDAIYTLTQRVDKLRRKVMYIHVGEKWHMIDGIGFERSQKIDGLPDINELVREEGWDIIY